MNMPAMELKTVVRCYKIKIKNKFKCLEEETNSAVAKLQSCVSEFKCRLSELVDRTDKNFFCAYENLNRDFEKYQETICYLLASFDNPSDCIGSNAKAEIINLQAGHNSLGKCTPVGSHSSLEENSSQTKPKTILQSQASLIQSQASLISSSSYRSLQDYCNPSVTQTETNKEQNVVELSSRYNVENNLEDENISSVFKNENSASFEQQPVFDMSKTSKSVSQNSCYRSLSSNTSFIKSSTSSNLEETYLLENSVNKKHDQNMGSDQRLPPEFRPNLLIFPPVISINAVVSASLTHIKSPEDFWMQLKNSGSEISYFRSQFIGDSPPSCIRQGDFCLAPFKSCQYYYRAKALNEAKGDDEVEVFFIDHGSTQMISLKNLRSLPSAAYKIPMQAFHCCLSEISPINGIWTDDAIEKLKEFQNNSIETYVHSLNCDKYAVQLIATISCDFSEDFSCDIAQALCLDGLATFKKVVEINEACRSSEISNQISCDSGVSVTSNQRASPNIQKLSFSSETLAILNSTEPENDLPKKNLPESESPSKSKSNGHPNNNVPDLISFESIEEICDENEESFAIPKDEFLDIPEDKSSAATEYESAIIFKRCMKNLQCNCALHLTVPPPSVSFVEKDMMVVMLSSISHPNEFYVNLAMEDSFTLDELREQMTIFYDSEEYLHPVTPDEVQSGMFCAGRYDLDGNWYRVQILKIESKEKSYDVHVQYIDYGNKALIKHDNLRPLLPKFAKHPSFSIKCSLAGVKPKHTEDSPAGTHEKDSVSWSNKAIEKFQQLTSYDRCLTAQICETRPILTTPVRSTESRPLQVLLWDTEDANDRLINEALVGSGLAEIDYDYGKRLLEQTTLPENDKMSVLNNWDPMNEEFNDIENSYGVHLEDCQVAVSGYKPRDESYICHRFSMHGYCFRGDNCPYEHVLLDGATRDQEETYSLDSLPSLPSPSTYVLAQVSAVINPGLFYCVLPYGNKSVDEIDSLMQKGSSPEIVMKHGNEVKALFAALNKHYTDAPFMENTAVSLAYGSIVVAFRKADNSWHRGRIIDVSDIAGPSKVFFVDFGNEEWVPRKSIRQILPEYLFTSFQAIECHLSDIEPLGYEKGKKWSPQAVHRFKELVAFEVLLAHVTNRCGKILHLSLKKTSKDNHENIGDILVKEGFAQSLSLSFSTSKESKYVPG